jgi:cell division septation protein DedD
LGEWLAEDGADSIRNPASLQEFATEKLGVPANGPVRSDNTAQTGGRTTSWRDEQDTRTGTTYLQRLARMWTRRAAVAAMCVVVVNVATLAACQFSSRLAGQTPRASTPPTLAAHSAMTWANMIAVPAPAVAAPSTSTSAPEPAARPDGYLVAVGLFSTAERADGLVQYLAHSGFSVVQRPYQLGNRIVRQVLIGPFVDRTGALAGLERLRQLGGHDDAHVIDESAESPSH